VAYRTLLGANRTVHWVHEVFHWPYWSLAQHVKNRMARARRYVVEFRRAALHAAREAGMDGVICGHIHRADLARHEGLLYCNDGDWVESCTALVEDQRGELVLIDWRRQPAFVPLDIVVSDAA
jgi:UDP-2,3-diacylglucosamine pyrophosphatase LpxH